MHESVEVDQIAARQQELQRQLQNQLAEIETAEPVQATVAETKAKPALESIVKRETPRADVVVTPEPDTTEPTKIVASTEPLTAVIEATSHEPEPIVAVESEPVEATEELPEPESHSELLEDEIAAILSTEIEEGDALTGEGPLADDLTDIDLSELPEFQELSELAANEADYELPEQLIDEGIESDTTEPWVELAALTSPETAEAAHEIVEALVVLTDRLQESGPKEAEAIEQVLEELCIDLFEQVGLSYDQETIETFLRTITVLSQQRVQQKSDAITLEEGTYEQRKEDHHILNTLIRYLNQKALSLQMLGRLALLFHQREVA